MTRSEIFFLEVRPFNEKVLAGGQPVGDAGSDRQPDRRLISAQKDIISATWNLERRTAAGRSATDIKGVADAQVESKGRAERAASTERQRQCRAGSRTWRQPPAPAQPAADPVIRAAEAMNRAALELQGQKTAGAFPHEMAAFNAPASGRRTGEKQVAQQRSRPPAIRSATETRWISRACSIAN